ncbi:MAG: hypothetical protein QW620_04690 [Thermoplasmata archaeon]
MKGTRLKSELLVAVWMISFLICAISFGVDSESINNEHENTISASYQNPTLKVSVSVDKIKEGRPVDVTVVVKDAYGKPVPNATVGVYILKDSHLQPTDIPNGTTNSEGIVEFEGIVIRDVPEGTQVYFVAVYYWDYGYWAVTVEKATSLEQNICIIVAVPVIILGIALIVYSIFNLVRKKVSKPRGAVFGTSLLVITGFYLFFYFTGSFEWDKFLAVDVFVKSIVLSIIAPIVLEITANSWYVSTVIPQKRFKAEKIEKIFAKHEDPSSEAKALQHVDRNLVFKKWNEMFEKWIKNLESEKNAQYFLEGSKNMLQSFRCIKENKNYGGASIGRKEVESFYDDKIIQTLKEPYTLYKENEIKKPESPPKGLFINDRKIFPYSQREIGCPECNGKGKVKCYRCSGTGVIKCPKCDGRGYFLEKFVVEKEIGPSSSSSGVTHGPVGGWWTEERKIKHPSGVETKVNISHYASSGTPGYLKYEIQPLKIKRTEYVTRTCGLCGGKGNIGVCETCNGSGMLGCGRCDRQGKLRELRVKIWDCTDIMNFNTHLPSDKIEIRWDNFNDISSVQMEEGKKSQEINRILRDLQERHEKWIKGSSGSVLSTEYKAYVFPVTKCIVEYNTDTGKKTFSLWAIGTPKKWILIAPEVPLPLKPSKKFSRRHILFALTILSEIIIFAFLYKLLIFT